VICLVTITDISRWSEWRLNPWTERAELRFLPWNRRSHARLGIELVSAEPAKIVDW